MKRKKKTAKRQPQRNRNDGKETFTDIWIFRRRFPLESVISVPPLHWDANVRPKTNRRSPFESRLWVAHVAGRNTECLHRGLQNRKEPDTVARKFPVSLI